MNDGAGDPSVLVLTDLTRRGGEDRRVVVQGIDLPLRNVIIGLAGFVLGAPAGVLAVAILRPLQSVIDPVYVWGTTVLLVEALTYVAVMYRVRSGVGIFQPERDRRSSGNGRVWIGTERVTSPRDAAVEICERAALPLQHQQRPAAPFEV